MPAALSTTLPPARSPELMYCKIENGHITEHPLCHGYPSAVMERPAFFKGQKKIVLRNCGSSTLMISRNTLPSALSGAVQNADRREAGDGH